MQTIPFFILACVNFSKRILHKHKLMVATPRDKLNEKVNRKLQYK